MKQSPLFLLLFISLLHSIGCETEHQPYFFKNESRDTIAVFFFDNKPIPANDHVCVKPTNKAEYRDLLRNDVVYPNGVIDLGHYGDYFSLFSGSLYFYAFLLDDVLNMPCDEFERTFPVKRVWVVTKEDMEQCGWTLTYP